MKSGRLTIILLAVTIVLALAVPTLRESFTDRATQAFAPPGGSPAPSQLAEIVAEAPQDAQLQYAYALALWAELQNPGQLAGQARETVTADAVRDVFRDAISLAPDDPAPRLSLAIFEIGQAKVKRLPGEERADDEPFEAPTAQQLEAVRGARELLAEIRRLDPGNALPDYLLAWTWLAEGRTEVALDAASRGAAKDGWTTYQAEGATALLALIEQTPVPGEFAPMAVISINANQTFPLGARLRSMARALRDAADDFHARGDHDEAIRSYEVILRAGHLMRENARNLIDGLLGVALSEVTVSSDGWAPPDEAQLLEGNDALSKTDLRLPRFAAYLRNHGRPDLAAFAEAEIETGKRWKALCRELTAQMMSELTQDIAGGPMMNAMAVWLTTAIMLGLAALVGLLSLIARYWREPRTHAGWSHLQWLVLLALALLPAQAGVWIAMRRFVSQGAEAGSTTMSIIIAGVALSVILWVIGVLVLTLRKRRRLPAEDRLSGPRSFLRGLRALVCPTLAALILLCMPATLAIERNFDQMGAKHRQLAIEGEVAYYGLQADAQAVQSESSDADGG